MKSIAIAVSQFQEGDEVVLVHGTYPGRHGVFLRLKEDANWADILESSGQISSHPVIWMALSAKSDLSSKN